MGIITAVAKTQDKEYLKIIQEYFNTLAQNLIWTIMQMNNNRRINHTSLQSRSRICNFSGHDLHFRNSNIDYSQLIFGLIKVEWLSQIGVLTV